mmetsp:Transcript_19986/g.32512  ORF Transcript_19986/g.32512 Transcript_19986/m.32512 type:complete len:224 (-) Transcript_19986:231-902(-)|eukprot:jgi/Bigna1/54445/estExt_Genewise1Plus.C_340020
MNFAIITRFVDPVLAIPRRHPFVFGVVTAAIKTGGADFMVQKYVEKQKKIDWRRVGVFTTFGFLFCGCWQYFLFVKSFPRLFPDVPKFINKPIGEKLRDRRGLRDLGIQVFIENGINNALIYFPIYYSIKEMLKGNQNFFRDGFANYRKNAHEDLPAIWAVWVPAQFINFGLSPMWFRVPFVSLVSALWTCYVSSTRGKMEEDVVAEVMLDEQRGGTPGVVQS